MILSIKQAEDIFAMLLTYGYHNRDADEAYQRDFVMRFTYNIPMEYWYRTDKNEPVWLYSDSNWEGISIIAVPGYALTTAEEEQFKAVNRLIADYLDNSS